MNAARSSIVRTLARAGGWVGRDELATRLSFSEQRVDDELADLVADGSVLFNPRGRDYRLGFTPLARRALQRLMGSREQRMLLGHVDAKNSVTRIGVAVRARDFTGSELLTVAELEMPYDPTDPTHGLQAVADAAARLDRRLAEKEGVVFPEPAFVSATEGQQP